MKNKDPALVQFLGKNGVYNINYMYPSQLPNNTIRWLDFLDFLASNTNSLSQPILVKAREMWRKRIFHVETHICHIFWAGGWPQIGSVLPCCQNQPTAPYTCMSRKQDDAADRNKHAIW